VIDSVIPTTEEIRDMYVGRAANFKTTAAAERAFDEWLHNLKEEARQEGRVEIWQKITDTGILS